MTKTDPRYIAATIVYQVMERGAYTNIALDKYLHDSQLRAEDRHLITEIVSGTVRMIKHLDWVLNLFLSKPVANQHPWLRNIMRISLYQMLFMDKIPDYACVDSAVKLVRQKTGPQLSGVANAVLRNIARNRNALPYPDRNDMVRYLAVYYSQPEWLVKKWLAEYEISVVRDMLIYFNQRPGMVLRTNGLLITREELLERLKQEGVPSRASQNTPWAVVPEEFNQSLDKLKTYQLGYFYVQNEASMLAPAILNPGPNENIIDLCCGIGGKTTFLAELMNNTGQIDAYDVYQHKIDLLKNNCERLRIVNVSGHCQDILALPAGHQTAPGILVDAPCSGMGVLNRRPDSRWRKAVGDVDVLTALQYSLLEKAGQMVTPGGRLVYSTCTINPSENEEIVLKFLNNNSAFRIEGFAEDIGFFPLDNSDQSKAEAGMLTIIPGKYGTDGMFYARMRRSRG